VWAKRFAKLHGGEKRPSCEGMALDICPWLWYCGAVSMEQKIQHIDQQNTQ